MVAFVCAAMHARRHSLIAASSAAESVSLKCRLWRTSVLASVKRAAHEASREQVWPRASAWANRGTRAGDRAGHLGEARIGGPVPGEALGHHHHAMGNALPLAHQQGPGPDPDPVRDGHLDPLA